MITAWRDSLSVMETANMSMWCRAVCWRREGPGESSQIHSNFFFLNLRSSKLHTGSCWFTDVIWAKSCYFCYFIYLFIYCYWGCYYYRISIKVQTWVTWIHCWIGDIHLLYHVGEKITMCAWILGIYQRDCHFGRFHYLREHMKRSSLARFKE